MATVPGEPVVIKTDDNTLVKTESDGSSVKQEPAAELSLSTHDTVDETSPAAWKPSSREWLILLCLCVISMVVALDSNIIGPVLPVGS